MENIRRMERQWRTMGGAYDWSKEVATCLPEYYRWNQWLFLQFLERGLAYRQKAPVNWCPNHDCPGQRAGPQRSLLEM